MDTIYMILYDMTKLFIRIRNFSQMSRKRKEMSDILFDDERLHYLPLHGILNIQVYQSSLGMLDTSQVLLADHITFTINI